MWTHHKELPCHKKLCVPKNIGSPKINMGQQLKDSLPKLFWVSTFKTQPRRKSPCKYPKYNGNPKFCWVPWFTPSLMWWWHDEEVLLEECWLYYRQLWWLFMMILTVNEQWREMREQQPPSKKTKNHGRTDVADRNNVSLTCARLLKVRAA